MAPPPSTTMINHQSMIEETKMVEDKLATVDFSETECSSTISLTDSLGADHPKSVSFRNVEIREYKVILGDNPALRSGGPPVQIDWTPLSSCTLSIEDHQASRRDNTDERPRCGGKSMPADRISYLLEEYSSSEIRKAQSEARKVQQSRLHHKRDGFESFRLLMEKVARKLRKKQSEIAKPGSAEEWVKRYKQEEKERSLSISKNASA